jgi:sugar lactone lactonase YvrE
MHEDDRMTRRTYAPWTLALSALLALSVAATGCEDDKEGTGDLPFDATVDLDSDATVNPDGSDTDSTSPGDTDVPDAPDPQDSDSTDTVEPPDTDAGGPDGDAVEPPDGDAVEPPDGDAVEPPDGDTVEPADGDTVEPPDGDTIEPPDGDTVEPPDSDTIDPPDGDVVDPPDTGEEPCDHVNAMPVSFENVPGFTGSEDFAFDADGKVVLSKGNNLVRMNIDGTGVEILVPNIGGTAGTSVLPNGNIIVAKGNSLLKVYKTGGSETLLSGLSYPNGMDVDQDNYAYVAEQSGSRLRRVNTETGEFEILADKLTNPNGVGFSPGYDRVYVGSFGGGKVWYLDRLPGGGWGPAQVLATIDGDNTPIGVPIDPIDPPEVVYTPCEGKGNGEACFTELGAPGICHIIGETAKCTLTIGAGTPQEAACAGLADEDPCAIPIYGYDHPGTCSTDYVAPECCDDQSGTGCANKACEDCVCPPDPFCCNTQWDNICANAAKTQCDDVCFCSGGGVDPVPEGETYCQAKIDPTVYCDGLEIGDLCPYIDFQGTIYGGRCDDLATNPVPSGFPKTGIGCIPPALLTPGGGGGGGGGGLDGLNVDECGNVYVTEYVKGYIWRIRPNGLIEPPLKVPSSWIPNMEFGNGKNGLKPDHLYVISLGGSNGFALDIGVFGKEVTMPPPGTFD